MRRMILKWTVLTQAGALLLYGCSGDDGKRGVGALVRIDEIDPGSECAAGGYDIATGPDADGNGELDDDEVEDTQTICQGGDGSMAGEDGADGRNGTNGTNGSDGEDGTDGADGFTTLTTSRALAVGDEQCRYGGLEISAGLDNGDGSGTANDGTLQTGEVDDSEPLCSGKPLFVVKPTAPPEAPAGAYTISTTGGAGSATTGGSGGDFYSEISSGSLGGHIKVFATGVADASFDVPEVQTYLGDEPLEVTTGNVTVLAMADADHTGLVAGNAHTHASSNNVYLWNGTTDDTVTGVSIAAGATLTLEPQIGGSTARVYVDNDFHNAGTLTTDVLADGRSKAGLEISCDVFAGDSDSAIDLAGADGTTGNDGGNGGYLDIDAQDGDLNTNQSPGAVFNQGNIDTSGGAGDNGGTGGYVDLYGNLIVVNTGAITSTGGTGNVSNGGSGGYIYFNSEYGNLSNSGALTSSGGDGELVGGLAGYVELYIGYPGDVRNSGDITARGGSADAACAAGCSGGNGNYVELEVYSGNIINSGDIDTRGGSGAAGPGGTGGQLYVYGYGYDSGWESSYQPIGGIEFSGNVDTRGGDGSSGGEGGYIGIEVDADYVPDSQEIILYGYTSVNTRGGNGITGGGEGGYFQCYQDYASGDGFPADYGPSGGCINYANLDLRGGDATTGGGGGGGYLQFETETYYAFGTTGEIVYNAGDVDNSGGNGGTSGGNPGYIYMFGFNWVENQGDLLSRGGSASTAAGTPGYSGANQDPHVQLTSDLGPAINGATIDISGGNMLAAGTAGEAGLIEIYGQSVDNSGDLIAAGGDGTIAGTTGGDGGDVFVYGLVSGTTNTGDVDVLGGDGVDADGEHGQVFIDSLNHTDDFLP